MLFETQKKIAGYVAQLVHADKKQEAAQYVAELSKIKIKLTDDDPGKYLPVLQNWLHWLLNSKAPFEAAQLLWTPTLFDPRPQFTRDVWQFYDEVSQGLIMGGSSCSKSFGIGVRLTLEWIRDPEWTTVLVAGPSQKHLESELFSHLVRLHSNASLPMPGECMELFIGADRRNQLGAIRGIVIPLGKLKKSGRIQGTKRAPRIQKHPKFGSRSRLYIFMDEVENIPEGIWGDVKNVLSQNSGDGGFKIFGAYNPVDPAHEVGKRAEPLFGWKDFDKEKHYRWKSARGWDVIRLDGEKCENVIEGREIFPGLQTREGLEAIAKDAGGRDSAGYSTQGRGCYPTQSVAVSLIPSGMFDNWRGEYIWFEDPTPVSACDLALEGGAAAEYSLGKFGLASGMKLPPNLQFPEGRIVMFKNAQGRVQPRYGLQVDQQFPLEKGETVAMAQQLENLNKKVRIKPEYFACDRTGVGAGTADLLKHTWGPQIHAVNYMEGASVDKLMAEDTKTCKDEYDRMHTELWYALRAWGEHGYLLINPSMDMTELKEQVTHRWTKIGKQNRIESKKDFIDRRGKSPDKADSLTLIVHAARKGSSLILSRLGEPAGDEAEDDRWYDTGIYKGGARIDPSNRNDQL